LPAIVQQRTFRYRHYTYGILSFFAFTLTYLRYNARQARHARFYFLLYVSLAHPWIRSALLISLRIQEHPAADPCACCLSSAFTPFPISFFRRPCWTETLSNNRLSSRTPDLLPRSAAPDARARQNDLSRSHPPRVPEFRANFATTSSVLQHHSSI